jgi:hypothetical protein
MATTLPPIAMFWTGAPVDWMQRLSMHSFVNHGYKVTLFSPKDAPIDPQCDGVEVAAMEDVYVPSRRMGKHAAPACLADVFRLYLMAKTDYVWMDSDMLSISPITLNQGYAMSWSSPGGQINNAALRVPQDSDALQYLINHIEDPELIPEWMNRDHRAKLKELAPDRRLLAQGKMLRIVYGPRGLNHALQKTGESEFASPMEAYSPVPWWLTDLFYSPKGDAVAPYITEDTRVIHLFNDQIRKWNKNRMPPEGCFLDQYIKQSGFSI